jgi:hypothetical protein
MGDPLDAKRVTTNRPGHICAIVPETDSFVARRKAGGVIANPLQTKREKI